jgi:hypothetical protein
MMRQEAAKGGGCVVSNIEQAAKQACVQAMRVLSVLLVVAFTTAIDAPQADARHLKVYSPYELEAGEFELAYWLDAFVNTPIPTSGPFIRQHLLRHTGELAYGITDHWYAAVYVDFEQPTKAGTDQFTFVQNRFETIYRLLDQRTYWPAIGLYAEYTLPRRQYERRDEVEFKLLLQYQIRKFLVRLNPVLEREFNDGSNVGFGYENGWYWLLSPAVRAGVEGFGHFGPLGSFPTTNSQSHSWGPAMKFKLGKIGWDLGVQFGWTDASDYVVVKSIIDFEF